MTLEVRQDPEDPRRLQVTGELDLATADDLVVKVTGLSSGSSGDLVLDLRGLEFVDSTGIRALIGVAAQVRGGSLVLEAPNPTVRRVLELVRADSFPNVRIDWGS